MSATDSRNDALAAATGFMHLATAPEASPRDAAEWSLAAKNATSIALICVQIEATDAKVRREQRAGR